MHEISWGTFELSIKLRKILNVRIFIFKFIKSGLLKLNCSGGKLKLCAVLMREMLT
jgi:hypothetical protein